MSSNTQLSNEQKSNQVKDESFVSESVQNIPNRRKLASQDSAKVEKSPSAFRTISEVADEIGVQQHVLRFWESKFSYIKPLKRGGGRRYYRPEDVTLIKGIHHLLYTEGYTIKGVQKLLQKTRGNLDSVLSGEVTLSETSSNTKEQTSSPIAKAVEENREELETMLQELKSMRDLIG